MCPLKTTEGAKGLVLGDYLLTLIPENTQDRASLRKSVIPNLLVAISEIARGLRASSEVAVVGTENPFGDEQLNVDVLAEGILRDAIRKTPSICTASSEEDPIERPAREGEQSEVNGGISEKYSIAFDPLDGSSIIGPNWSVGAIIGIWDGETCINQPSKRQIASILGVFGPRTLAIVALRIPGLEDVCFEVGINDGGEGSSFSIIRPRIRLSDPPFKTRYFAPANLRSAADNAKYMALISRYIHESYTLRYAGGLIPDIFHALVKGHGVYISPVMDASKAKLRRLYELFPVALVIECAGGNAIDPQDGTRILDCLVKGCDDRGGIICGTSEEVEKVREALLG